MTDALATVLSTILGAVIGAVVSWIIARQASRETLRRDQEERRERKLTLAYQAFVKLKTIIDSVGTLDGMLRRALTSGQPGARPWMLVEPIIGSSQEHETHFDAAEIALFVEAGSAQLAEDLQMIARRHTTAGTVIAEYNTRRQALAEKMPPALFVQGTAATTALTPEQFALVQRDMIGLDSLILQLTPALAEDLELGLSIASRFGPALRTHFKDNRFPGFRGPDTREVQS